MTIQVTPTETDFTELHERLKWYVDEKIIPSVISVVLKGDDVIDTFFCGGLDLDADKTLDENSIFRMHSSTKIACSLGAMMLWEEGRFNLDDPIEKYIPALGNLQVLKKDAVTPEDTEPARDSIRINQLLSHTAGLSYGFVDPESLIDRVYAASALNPLAPGAGFTLESLCESLGELPLAFQPGTSWRYSFATDVMARLIEILSGKPFDEFLKERLLEPLGMTDTDFYVPRGKLDRLTTLYLPADPLDPMSPCVAPMDERSTTSLAEKPSFLSGGGGLVSTLKDYLQLTRMVINQGRHGEQQLIKPETLALMRTNQCADGVNVMFPAWVMTGTTFGLGFALKGQPAEGEPDSAVGEYHWGGMAGTHFWWSPKADITGICMIQRMVGFWHPHSHDFKRLAYKIAG